MSQPLLARVSLPVCSSWESISSMRLQHTSALIIAERFWSAMSIGSYILVTTSRNMKNVSTSISPLISRVLPATATVPMPSFSTICAEQTNAAFENSETIECFSTAFILRFRSSV